MAIKYAHTNVIARDWRALSQFYIDVFGCTPVPPERDISGDWVDALTGFTGCTIRGIHLALPGYEGGPTLEIFSYEPKTENEPKALNSFGFAHIAFCVDDVESMLNRLLAFGGSRLGEIVKKQYDQLGELTAVYARDIEGNIIELQNWAK